MSTRAIGWRRLGVAGALLMCAVAAVVALFDAVALVFDGTHGATDFRPYFAAAEDVLRGESPYPAPNVAAVTDGAVYIYPPLTALVVVPLTALPLSVAEGLVVIAGVLAVVATLLALDVRDWRCYVVAFLWVPVLNAIGLGNLTIFLVLGAALTWRYRDRSRGAATLGTTLAAKLFLWPLVVWMVATRRVAYGALAIAVALCLLVVSWAAIGFAGLLDYQDILRIAHSLWADDAYSVYAIALDAGVPDGLAGFIGLALAASLLGASVVSGRRGEDRVAFVLAIAAALAFSPIVWRHYFALLLVPVAIARPRLGVVWFVPVLMWPVSEGIGNGTTFQTTATLVIASLTIGLALSALARDDRDLVVAIDRSRSGLGEEVRAV